MLRSVGARCPLRRIEKFKLGAAWLAAAEEGTGEGWAGGGRSVGAEVGGAGVHPVDEHRQLGPEAGAEVNLFGAWRLAIALLPLLRQSAHPRIVNVSSGAGSHGDNQFGLAKRGGTAASYGISKAALNALTSTLAAELADTPILVNAVCPA